jgi:hypothetical protein
MENPMKQVFPALLLLVAMALPIAAQKKKSAVKLEYDKFKDITCATVDLGDLATVRVRLATENVAVLMDAFYCAPGQTVAAPTSINVRLRSQARSWLSGMRDRNPLVIFLLDDSERLTFSGKYEYVVDKVLGGASQITFRVAPDELAKIGDAKTVEFQVTGESYKLDKKNLSRLKDLAEYAPASTK